MRCTRLAYIPVSGSQLRAGGVLSGLAKGVKRRAVCRDEGGGLSQGQFCLSTTIGYVCRHLWTDSHHNLGKVHREARHVVESPAMYKMTPHSNELFSPNTRRTEAQKPYCGRTRDTMIVHLPV